MSTAVEKRWYTALATIDDCVLCGRFGCQISHSNVHRGKSQKSAPWLCARICPVCHEDIDNGKTMTKIERREAHARAINLTHARLIESGMMVLA